MERSGETARASGRVSKPEDRPKAAQAAKAPTKTPKKPLDGVDQASMDSFPASDPPSHWAGHDAPPLLNGEEQDD